MFSSILRPCSRLDAKNSYPNSDVSLSYWTVPGKWYPILDQNSLISIPYPRLNCSKTLPFTEAHIAYIWEYPPWRFRLFLVQYTLRSYKTLILTESVVWVIRGVSCGKIDFLVTLCGNTLVKFELKRLRTRRTHFLIREKRAKQFQTFFRFLRDKKTKAWK